MLEELEYLDLLEEDQSLPEVQYQVGLCYLEGRGVQANEQRARAWMQEAANQGYEPAIQALRKAEAAEAINENNLAQWCARAEQGSGEAMYQVALYLMQHSIPGTEKDAQRYMEGAAEQGQGDACLILGKGMLEKGSFEKAVKYLTRAAECSVRQAMKLLGECCAEGKGVPKDPARAEAWFVRAAEQGQGDARCMMELALRYKHGRGVEPSFVKALSWKQRAQDAGLEDASRLFELDMLEDGWDLQKYLESAKQGDAESQYRAGRCYACGDGAAKDPKQAEYWLRQAAQQGHVQAERTLAELLQDQGREEESQAWQMKAVQDGDETQILSLAERFMHGNKASVQKGFSLLEKLAKQGCSEAQVRLGFWLEEGIVEDDRRNSGIAEAGEKQAAQWYRRAAEQDNLEGLWRWGRALWGGFGVPRDLEAAGACLEKAAEQESPKAMRFLGACYADGYQHPGKAYCDIKRMLYWYEKAAVQGDPVAQGNLAAIYWTGIDAYDTRVLRDTSKAVHYARQAAEQENDSAQKILGDCCQKGIGMPRDMVKAAQWYRKAAENGNRQARYQLGLCLLEGEGVPQDKKQAYQCFYRSVHPKDGDSMNMVARCLENGWGVPLNVNQAIQWYNKALQAGSGEAALHLANLYKQQGRGQEQSETIFYLYGKAAQAGITQAQRELGICFELGQGTTKNPKQAVYWYQKALNAGDGESGYRLANLYLEGSGVMQDMTRGVQFLQAAANLHHAQAAYRLAGCLENGTGIRENTEQAVFWYRYAAQNGVVAANFYLGDMYREGRGTAPDIQKAFLYYKAGAQQDEEQCLNMLGRCCEEGWGTQQNYYQAAEWYERAVKKGSAVACYNLARIYLEGDGGLQNWNRAVDLLNQGVQKNEPNSEILLGDCLLNGVAVRKNRQAAITLYTAAADQGHPGGLTALGRYYMDKYSAFRDDDRALECLVKAAQMGWGPAMKLLGAYWEMRPQFSNNLQAALEWYQCAAEHGEEGAQEEADRLRSATEKPLFGDLGQKFFGKFLGK